jgi:hypothetical protein
MKFETILTLGVIGVVLYLVLELLKQFGVNPATVQGAITATGNTVENAATGQLSNAQQSDLISQETSQLIALGVDPTTAQAQATQDVNATLALPQPTYWDGVKAAFSYL